MHGHFCLHANCTRRQPFNGSLTYIRNPSFHITRWNHPQTSTTFKCIYPSFLVSSYHSNAFGDAAFSGETSERNCSSLGRAANDASGFLGFWATPFCDRSPVQVMSVSPQNSCTAGSKALFASRCRPCSFTQQTAGPFH